MVQFSLLYNIAGLTIVLYNFILQTLIISFSNIKLVCSDSSIAVCLLRCGNFNVQEIQNQRFWISSPPKMRPTGCPETSVSIYHYTLPNNPQQRTSHLHPGGSLQQLLSHCSVYNKCLLLLDTTAVNNSSSAYSQRRITSKATGVVRLRVEQSSSGAAPRCIVCCCTSTGDEPRYIPQHAQPFTSNWLVY
jgi:hypothetical protein